jgi:hypothetical protein
MRRSGRQQPGADDARPQGIGPALHQVVRVPRHVRAVEVAEAEVDDAGPHPSRVEARRTDGRAQAWQIAAAQLHSAHAYVASRGRPDRVPRALHY